MAEEEGLKIRCLGCTAPEDKDLNIIKKKDKQNQTTKNPTILRCLSYPDISVNPENVTGSGVDPAGENLRNCSYSVCNSDVSLSVEAVI